MKKSRDGIIFTDSELAIIVGALHVAASTYEGDAVQTEGHTGNTDVACAKDCVFCRVVVASNRCWWSSSAFRNRDNLSGSMRW